VTLDQENPFTSVGPGVSLPSAIGLMRQKNVHHLLVFEDAQLIGVISDRDILAKGMSDDNMHVRSDLTIRDVMQGEMPELPAPEDESAIEARAKILASHPIGIRLVELLNDIGI